MKIVAGVDLILGPLLTLIACNAKKASRLLKLDFLIIILLQFSALSFGTYIVFQERPVLQVLSDDGLYIHSYSEVRNAGKDVDYLKVSSSQVPIIAYLALPEDKEKSDLVKFTTEITEGVPATLRTDLYREIETVDRQAILARLGEKVEADDCFEVPLISFHITSKGCFSLTKGLIYLIN